MYQGVLIVAKYYIQEIKYIKMENIKFQKLEKGYILVNYNTFKQLNPIVFDGIGDFFNGFAKVYKTGKGWYWLNTNGGELIFN